VLSCPASSGDRTDPSVECQAFATEYERSSGANQKQNYRGRNLRGSESEIRQDLDEQREQNWDGYKSRQPAWWNGPAAEFRIKLDGSQKFKKHGQLEKHASTLQPELRQIADSGLGQAKQQIGWQVGSQEPKVQAWRDQDRKRLKNIQI